MVKKAVRWQHWFSRRNIPFCKMFFSNDVLALGNGGIGLLYKLSYQKKLKPKEIRKLMHSSRFNDLIDIIIRLLNGTSKNAVPRFKSTEQSLVLSVRFSSQLLQGAAVAFDLMVIQFRSDILRVQQSIAVVKKTQKMKLMSADAELLDEKQTPKKRARVEKHDKSGHEEAELLTIPETTKSNLSDQNQANPSHITMTEEPPSLIEATDHVFGEAETIHEEFYPRELFPEKYVDAPEATSQVSPKQVVDTQQEPEGDPQEADIFDQTISAAQVAMEPPQTPTLQPVEPQLHESTIKDGDESPHVAAEATTVDDSPMTKTGVRRRAKKHFTGIDTETTIEFHIPTKPTPRNFHPIYIPKGPSAEVMITEIQTGSKFVIQEWIEKERLRRLEEGDNYAFEQRPDLVREEQERFVTATVDNLGTNIIQDLEPEEEMPVLEQQQVSNIELHEEQPVRSSSVQQEVSMEREAARQEPSGEETLFRLGEQQSKSSVFESTRQPSGFPSRETTPLKIVASPPREAEIPVENQAVFDDLPQPHRQVFHRHLVKPEDLSVMLKNTSETCGSPVFVFQTMCPPDSCSKQFAASAFYQLLCAKVRGDVQIKQEENNILIHYSPN